MNNTKTLLCRFALLRHAQTHWNTEKRIQGHLDSPLTDLGQQQAHMYGRRLQTYGFTAILCSDLGRTLHTAEIINKYLKLPLSEDARLREQDWGRWSGKTLASIQREEGELLSQQVAAGWKFTPPEGEDRRAIFERGCQVFFEWTAKSKKSMNTLIITHEGMIKSLIYGLAGRKFLPSEPPLIASNHLHWIACDGRHLLAERINAQNMNEDVVQ